jgi:hypothetical protein
MMTDVPEAMAHGRFSLYVTDGNGYHIAYKFDTEDETRHIDIPGRLVTMARLASGGQVDISNLMSMQAAK